MKFILNDLVAEQSVVDKLVSELTDEQWHKLVNHEPGEDCGGWMIQDEIIHIALFDQAAAKLIKGEASMLTEAIPRGTQDEYYRCIKERNSLSKNEVLSWWRESRTRMDAAFYEVEPKARIPWAPGLPMSAKSLASARLMELWAHSIDIYDTLNLPFKVEERIVHTLFLSWQARPNAYRINGMEMPDTPIYLKLTLPSGAIWEKGDANELNYIKGSAEDWALVAIRRRNWMDTSLEVVGDEARRYATFVQTYAGKADCAPEAKHQD